MLEAYDSRSNARVRPASKSETRRDLTLLLVAVLGILALFLDKAYTIDDPLFVRLGQHLANNFVDFFGFDVNWYGTRQPIYEVTKNPPLTGYFIAAARSLGGHSEIALHIAFLLSAAGVASGTYLLARRCCGLPLEASLIGLLTPVFMVSSTSVMSDTTMLAFWCWSIYWWMRGIDEGRPGALVMGATLAGVACMTKYFGAALIPLLAAYAVFRMRPAKLWLWPLLVPVALLLSYELYTLLQYNTGLLSDAASYATRVNSKIEHRSPFGRQTMVGLIFAGGCFIPALFYAPLLWSRRIFLGGSALCLASTILAIQSGFLAESGDSMKGPVAWYLIAQRVLMAFAGVSLIGFVTLELWRSREPTVWILGLWVLGTFVFASYLNWVNNGRSILPMVPAAGILLLRRLETRKGLARNHWRYVALGASAIIAITVTYGDYAWANEVRRAARTICDKYAGKDHKIYFHGHWGFQHYMRQCSAKPLDILRHTIMPGDVIVRPINNSYPYPIELSMASFQEELRFPDPSWIHIMSQSIGASFYASNIGLMPFAFGQAEPDRYHVWRAKKVIFYHRQLTDEQRP